MINRTVFEYGIVKLTNTQSQSPHRWLKTTFLRPSSLAGPAYTP